jgi:hypothetical protein
MTFFYDVLTANIVKTLKRLNFYLMDFFRKSWFGRHKKSLREKELAINVSEFFLIQLNIETFFRITYFLLI